MRIRVWVGVVLVVGLLVAPLGAAVRVPGLLGQAPLAIGPPMPVNSLFDVGQFTVRAGVAGACKGQLVAAILLEIAGVPYALLATERRFIFGEDREGDATDVWLGRIEADGHLTVQQHMPYRELVQRFPDMCQALVPLVVEGGS